jgi:hypothetical protein
MAALITRTWKSTGPTGHKVLPLAPLTLSQAAAR